MSLRLLPGLLLILVGTLVAFAIGEFALRLLYPMCTATYRVDDDFVTTLVPNMTTRCAGQDFSVVVRTNSAGFHDRERALKKPAAGYRVLVLGDSFMEALQVSQEKGFTALLERQLKQRLAGQEVEVMNLGLSGNGPAQYLHLFETKGVKYQPDVVLVAILLGNDFRDSHPDLKKAPGKQFYKFAPDGSLLPTTKPQISSQFVQARSFTANIRTLRLLRESLRGSLVEDWFARFGLVTQTAKATSEARKDKVPLDWHVYQKDVAPVWQEAFALSLAAMKKIGDIAEKNGAQLYVMTIPSVAQVEGLWQQAFAEQGLSLEPTKWDFDQPNRAVKQFCKEQGIRVLDLEPILTSDFEMNGRSHSFQHDGHWNEYGHSVAAQAAAEFLLQKSQ